MFEYFYTVGKAVLNFQEAVQDNDQSVGGAASTTRLPNPVTVDSLFGPIRSDYGGKTFYRAFVVKNTTTSSTLSFRVEVVDVSNLPTVNYAIGIEPVLINTEQDPNTGQWHLADTPTNIANLQSNLTWYSENTPSSVVTLPAQNAVMIWLRIQINSIPDIYLANLNIRFIDAATSSNFETLSLSISNAVYHEITLPYRRPTYESSVGKQIFEKVWVDFISDGYTRVSWRMNCRLPHPYPYVFQLYYSRVGHDTANDWEPATLPQIPAENFLIDAQARLREKFQNIYYRVLLITGDNTVYWSDPVKAIGYLDFEKQAIYREILRREYLAVHRFAGTKGILLRARRYGPMCSCVDPDMREIANSLCPICYGTGIVGGYHTPIFDVRAEISYEGTLEQVFHEEEMGMYDPGAVIPARFVAVNIVQTRDVWVLERSDKRFYVAGVKTVSSYNGLPISFLAELRLANRKDMIYKFKLNRPSDYASDKINTCVISTS